MNILSRNIYFRLGVKLKLHDNYCFINDRVLIVDFDFPIISDMLSDLVKYRNENDLFVFFCNNPNIKPLAYAIQAFHLKSSVVVEKSKNQEINWAVDMFINHPRPYSTEKLSYSECLVLISICKGIPINRYLAAMSINIKTYYAQRASALKKIKISKNELFRYV